MSKRCGKELRAKIQTGRVRESSRKWQDQDFENMNLAHGTKDRGKHSNEGRAGHVYME